RAVSPAMSPVLAIERIAHHRYGSRLLRCGISTQAMSALGHKRTTDLASWSRECPLYPRKRTNRLTARDVRLVPKADIPRAPSPTASAAGGTAFFHQCGQRSFSCAVLIEI